MAEEKLERKWYDSPAAKVTAAYGLLLTSLLLGSTYVANVLYQDRMELRIAEQTKYQCQQIIGELAERAERGGKITKLGLERALQDCVVFEK